MSPLRPEKVTLAIVLCTSVKEGTTLPLHPKEGPDVGGPTHTKYFNTKEVTLEEGKGKDSRLIEHPPMKTLRPREFVIKTN